MLHRRLRSPMEPVLYACCRDAGLCFDILGCRSRIPASQPFDQPRDIEHKCGRTTVNLRSFSGRAAPTLRAYVICTGIILEKAADSGRNLLTAKRFRGRMGKQGNHVLYTDRGHDHGLRPQMLESIRFRPIRKVAEELADRALRGIGDEPVTRLSERAQDVPAVAREPR